MKATKIKSIRKNLGMTQHQFSETLGISQGFLSDLEKGSKTTSKSLSLLLKKSYSHNTDTLRKNIIDLDKNSSQTNTQSDKNLKLKYIDLMEGHVKALSEIINLKEEIFRLKEAKSKAI